MTSLADDRPLRLLVADDLVPVPAMGYGYPRSRAILEALAAAGDYRVTFFPLQQAGRREPETGELEARGIEVVGGGFDRFASFYRERVWDFDAVWISRPGNLRRILPTVQALTPGRPLVYDVEALTSLREALRREVVGLPAGAPTPLMLKAELEVMRPADVFVAVCDGERAILEEHGLRPVVCLGHPHRTAPTPRAFAERDGILFVGSFFRALARGGPRQSPNEDAVEHFLRDVFPRVRKRVDCRFVLAGFGSESVAVTLGGQAGVEVLGTVDALDGVYDAARVFVVPTRFAGGAPWKITEAMAYGVPSVVTPLVAAQLGLDEPAVRVGRGADDFAAKVALLLTDEGAWERQRRAGLDHVARACSPEAFAATVRTLRPLIALAAARRLSP